MLADTTAESPETRALHNYVRGKALNALDGYSTVAEELLTKAVKLKPKHSEAWTSLGLCMWKKGDLEQAKTCFKESLEAAENVEALQELSMLTRQYSKRGESPADRARRLQESLSIAKRAIALDVNNHKSWYIFGNAHCMLFFSGAQSLSDLQSALNAYRRSEALGGESNPDLWFNRGNVLRYLQCYEDAKFCYRRAAELDPSFTATEAAIDDINGFMSRALDMIARKGAAKKKKLESAIESLNASPHAENCAGFRDVYEDSANTRSLSVKVLMPISKGDVPPECYLCIDKNGECGIIAVYGIAASASLANRHDSAVLTVQQPEIRNSTESKLSEPSSASTASSPLLIVQAASPANLRLDGKPVGGTVKAPATLRVDVYES